ncbi:DUF3006 domain-containing protein [Paenibacillus sp. DXFW5]|uniref:DUF3006 domain-containing protein n=1 Tax=Paenibacillus rhizolycopersici TaxID=2780073 RepID=A0ABS2H242_9BACL|nr:DUF3006 domain-containing protein [Paenibacillus rhizolycopersici]MBM6994801.1 DUF3006 domain-containing protein [Paenibacillus rhizolycopersici]
MVHIVEGFEGEVCILESGGNLRNIPRSQVDPSAKPGDVVEWDGEKWVPNKQETERRTRQIHALMEEVWEEE